MCYAASIHIAPEFLGRLIRLAGNAGLSRQQLGRVLLEVGIERGESKAPSLDWAEPIETSLTECIMINIDQELLDRWTKLSKETGISKKLLAANFLEIGIQEGEASGPSAEWVKMIRKVFERPGRSRMLKNN